jgi:hypothetical protein
VTCRTGLTNAAVMLSEALQRNAKHEARLSNISVSKEDHAKNDQRFFATLRMTTIEELF